MVNSTLNLGIDPAAAHPERALALSYAPVAARHGVAALLALDATLARLARGTRDALVAQMRLAWWHDALTRLDAAPSPAQPILEALATDVLPHGVTGAALATIVDGWEESLADQDDAALSRHAARRGGALFAAVARVLRATDVMATSAGEGWALADVALRAVDPATRDRARALAGPILDEVTRPRWSRAGRAVGALAHSARMDLTSAAPGSPRRVARLLRHRLTGG